MKDQALARCYDFRSAAVGDRMVGANSTRIAVTARPDQDSTGHDQDLLTTRVVVRPLSGKVIQCAWLRLRRVDGLALLPHDRRHGPTD